MRVFLLLFITISSVVTLVVLGLDLDLLLNGPLYLSKVITNLVNRLHEEEIVNQEQLMETLLEARQTLWVHIPMVLVVVLCVVLLMLNCFGFAGACMFSYSLLSGFTMFMFVNLVLFTALAFWVFVNNMEDSVMDSFVMDKIAQYNQSEGIFNLVIDTVQRDLQCCGFKSSSDWSGRFPSSCCPDNCTNQICVEVGCALETVYTSSCLEMIRSDLLHPGSMVGMIGVTFLVVVVVIAVTTLLSLSLCFFSSRRKELTMLNNNSKYGADGSSVELMQPYYEGSDGCIARSS